MYKISKIKAKSSGETCIRRAEKTLQTLYLSVTCIFWGLIYFMHSMNCGHHLKFLSKAELIIFKCVDFINITENYKLYKPTSPGVNKIAG